MNTDRKPVPRAYFRAASITAGQAYVACMGLAVLLQLFLRDSSALFFAMNSLALYFFAPLPLLLAVGLWTRRREFLVGGLVLSALWLWQWGRLFSPLRLGKPSQVELRVATYNLLGFNRATEATIRELRIANADLVSLQELNPMMAQAIERELGGVYPFRRMDARAGVRGSGLLSRWPM